MSFARPKEKNLRMESSMTRADETALSAGEDRCIGDLIREKKSLSEQQIEAILAYHQGMMSEFVYDHHVPPEQTHVVEGLPEDVLPEIAEQLDAELILLGSLGRTGWSAALIGNTAEQVVDGLHCDLLVLKPDPATP